MKFKGLKIENISLMKKLQKNTFFARKLLYENLFSIISARSTLL
jgi:hypothetical protein